MMCNLYQKRGQVPANVENNLAQDLIQGTDSILVLAEKYSMHANIAKSIGISSMGKAMFEAREQKALQMLFNNIVTFLKQGLDSYLISKRLGISQRILYSVAARVAKCCWVELVEKIKMDTSDTDPVSEDSDFGFIQVQDDEHDSKDKKDAESSNETEPTAEPKRQPGKYYPVDRCQSNYHAHSRNGYHDGYHQPRNNRGYNHDRRNQPYYGKQYHDRRPYYSNDIRGNSPNFDNRQPRVPYNQVMMRYQGMEFYFNCGGKNPQEVVLELMREVRDGEL